MARRCFGVKVDRRRGVDVVRSSKERSCSDIPDSAWCEYGDTRNGVDLCKSRTHGHSFEIRAELPRACAVEGLN